MSTTNMTTADTRLRDTVLTQLEWDQEVDASGIGVAARDATVTLTGYIDTYAGKLAAERAAKHVKGVRAVANELEVRLKLDRTDTDIADDVVHALRVHGHIPAGVQATLHHGHVTLTGRVSGRYQKDAAESAVRHIRGVRHVANYIELTPQSLARDARKHIMRALHDHAALDGQHINVDVVDHVAILTGEAGSLLQRDAAEWAAAQTPGVTEIDNRIVVIDPRPSAGTAGGLDTLARRS